MKSVLNKKRATWIFALFALLTIALDQLGLGWANVMLSFNPVLTFFFQHAASLIVVSEKQLTEPSSIYIHYNSIAYLLHLVSVIALGLLVDTIRAYSLKLAR